MPRLSSTDVPFRRKILPTQTCPLFAIGERNAFLKSEAPMNSIHQTVRLLFPSFLLIVLIAIPFSPTSLAAGKHSNRAQARSRQLPNSKGPTARRSGSYSANRARAAERRRAEAIHRAEVARLAAIARQRAIDQAMRDQVQSMIARDDISGENTE